MLGARNIKGIATSFLLFMAITATQAQNWLSDYEFRNSITIQGAQVTGAHTDFPVLVQITGTDFSNNFEGRARSDGFDIVFTDSDGFTRLDHELQQYDETNDILTCWVKVNLTGADQTIFAYYGNAAITTDQSTSDVWSNGFRAVWHLEDDPNGDVANVILDDSGFANHGTPSGTMTTADLVAGQIGNGLDLDGADDFIDVVNSSSLQITDNSVTMSAWVNVSPGLNNDEGIILKGGNNDESFMLGVNDNGGTADMRVRINDSGNNTDGGTIPLTDTWHYVVGVYDGSNRIGYVDGAVAVTSVAFTDNIEHDPLDPIYLGRRADARFYEGRMDELRISDAPRSADWIETEYNNQSAPASFVNLNARENCSTPTPVGGTTTAMDEFLLSGGLTSITLAGNTSGTINWQQSTDNVTFSNVVGGAGDGTNTYTTPTLTQTTFYRALISNSGGCGTSNVVSSTATVNIVPAYGIGNYANRKRITIDADQVCGGSALTDFPMLFSFTSGDFRTVANGGSMQNVNGYDIAFTAADGATQLDHQLENYDPSTGEVVAWVRIPSLSNTTDTEIFIYYGDPSVTADQSVSSTWDTDFAAIWHLDNSLEDGTVNDQDGANNGSTDAEGFIGRGRFFDGVDDHITVTHVNGSSIDITGNQVTLEAWVKAPANTRDSPFIIKSAAVNQERYMLGIDGGTNLVNSRVTTDAGHFRDDSSPVNVDDWTHVVFVYDGTIPGAAGLDRKFVYVNGALFDQYDATGSILTTPADLLIGRRAIGDDRFFEGTLDELRVSTTARSADWICTEFNNQSSPNTFYTVESAQPCEPPVSGGTATASDLNIFSGESTTISLAGNTGSTIQWQSSTDNVNFADVVGANATTLSTGALAQTTYFRAIVSNGSCQTVSSTASVGIKIRFLDEYSFRKMITIDGSQVSGSSALNGFPLLISVVDPDLATAANKVQNANGFDIVFTTGDGTTRLTQYNEEYDAATGTFIAWVNVDLVPGEDTEIFMYYGNCAATVTDPTNTNTWDSNYVGVWLLNNTLDDATSFNHDSFDNGGTANIAGKIGDARSFSGTNQWLQVANSTDLNNTGTALTLSAWVNRDVDQNDDIGILIKSSNGGNQYQQHLGIEGADVANGRVRTGGTGQSRINGTTTLTPGTWYYITAVYDGAQLRVFTNGIQQNIEATTGNILDSSGDPVLLGRRALGDDRFFDGIIDNARISNVARSNDWVLTEFNNQNDPSSFYTVAAEEVEYYWSGGISGDWANANNWGACQVPAASMDVRIPSQPNDPILDGARTIGALIIESGASVDLNNNDLTLTGDLRNEGAFNQTDGTLTIAGSTQQRISGSNSLTINDLVMNNAAGANFAAGMQVDGTMTLTSGVVGLQDGNLVIGNSGSISGGTSSSFVATTGNGCVTQNNIGAGGRTGGILFPIGTSSTSYTPVTIDNTTGVADDFCIRVCQGFFQEGTCGTGTLVSSEVVDKTWFIDESVVGGSDVSITFQWNGSNELSGFDRSSVNLGHHNGVQWETLATTSAVGSDPYTATAAGVSDFSPFSAGSGASPLPIELLSFIAEEENGKVILTWETASEINNDFFTIERSADGALFEPIRNIDGAGDSNEVLSYEAVDNDPYGGVSFYRIKQTDFDGKFSYSHVEKVTVESDEVLSLSVYPSPNRGNDITVNVNGLAGREIVEIQIIDLVGNLKAIYLTESSRSGILSQQIKVSDLSAGIYLVKISTDLGSATEKIIID
ncbi:MAG: DUF2341 domain-containing protein [Bacteroidota bacterium]